MSSSGRNFFEFFKRIGEKGKCWRGNLVELPRSTKMETFICIWWFFNCSYEIEINLAGLKNSFQKV